MVKYKHPNGKFSKVPIAVAALGTKGVRVANLPLVVNDAVLMTSLAPFGKVTVIQYEKLAKSYRNTVAYRALQVTIMLTRHIPSHLTVPMVRILSTHDGQPAACYGCGGTGHIFQTCPKRQHRVPAATSIQRKSYAFIAARTDASQEQHMTNEAKV